MTEAKSPQERIAAARHLYATLKQYLERPTWTPLQGTLILAGIHPPADCTEIPAGGVGLDGKVLHGSNKRFFEARDIWKHWNWRYEDDQEEGEVTPTELSPYEFIRWCEDTEIETDWLRLFQDLIGYKPSPYQIDLVPSAFIEYATQTAYAVESILGKLGALAPDARPPETVATKGKKSAPRSPMPIPANREHLSTDELAAVLAVDPQSIRKSHSATGTYLGVRPRKLPNRRLLWPVDAVKRLLNGSVKDE
ncbi:hypothetical protein LJR296_003347 [Cupriavidus necator]|uniref:hypothetical protein n=1 Tax=Cupriavidus necator TaxID=106590 RepID=UPI003ECE3878